MIPHICWGFFYSQSLEPAITVLAHEAMTFKAVEHMILLGVIYNTTLSIETSMEYRLQKACFWKHFKVLSSLWVCSM